MHIWMAMPSVWRRNSSMPRCGRARATITSAKPSSRSQGSARLTRKASVTGSVRRMLTSEKSTAARRCRRMASTPISANSDQQQQPQRSLGSGSSCGHLLARPCTPTNSLGAAEALFDVFLARLMGGELHQVGGLQETPQPARLLGGEIVRGG